MSQPDEFLYREPEPPEPAPVTICDDCAGTGICDYEDGGPDKCDSCEGAGHYEPCSVPLDRVRLKALERALVGIGR